MLVRREVLEKLTEIADDEGGMPVFRFGFRKRGGGTMAEDGEDYDFCKRVTAIGYKVVADPRVATIHIKETGLLEYNWADWEAKWAEPTDEKSAAALKATSEKLAGQVAPLMEIGFAKNGCMVLDHTKQLAADEAGWAERVAKRHTKKEAA
jgi:hypothetical protein